MIILPVEIQKLRIGQLWDDIRITAGLDTIDGVREQCIGDLSI